MVTRRPSVMQLFAVAFFGLSVLYLIAHIHVSRHSLTPRIWASRLLLNFVGDLQRNDSESDNENFTGRQIDGKAPRHPYDFAAPDGPWSRAFFFNKDTIVLILLRLSTFMEQLKKAKDSRCRVGDLIGRMTRVRRSDLANGHPWDATIVYCKFGSSLYVTDAHLDRREYSHVRLMGNGTTVPLAVPKKPDDMFKLSVCVPPVHDTIRFQWIKEWILIYKEYIGVEHTFLYSYVADFRRCLRKIGIDERRTPFSVLDMSTQDKKEYDQYYRGQMLTIYDCLFLNRYLETKWTIFQDLDEVIWLPPKWRSLPHLLSDVERRYDAVGFGMWFANRTYCRTRSPGLRTFIDRMNLFWPQPHCGEMCPAWYGARKYVTKPSRAEYLFVHRPNFEIPSQRDRKIFNLNISEGFLRHYQTMAKLDIRPYPLPCSGISHRLTVRTPSIPFEEFINPRPIDNRTFPL